MRNIVDIALQVLLPSWGEINVSIIAAVLIILIIGVVRHVERFREAAGGFFLSAAEDFGVEGVRDLLEADKGKETSSKPDGGSSSVFYVKLELIAAKNLPAANLNGTSDPYAILTYGSQKRFSSLVPGSRNPMWGEVFDFYVDELPAKISVSIYDWDIIWKSTELGSTVINIEEEGQTEAIWHPLQDTSGQVCIQTNTTRASSSGIGYLRGRRVMEPAHGTEVLQKERPLQTIFNLPSDETVEHKFSCALERSFLYHGRMYVSPWHICFHSNVFAKQLKVVLPFEDIEEIKKSQHALINPAITIVLRTGSGGQGVPPLSNPDGRAKYKFASFWNRNHAHRVLLRAVKNCQGDQQDARQETFRRVHSMRNPQEEEETSAVPFVSNADESTPLEETKVVQPFINDDVLVGILEDIQVPCPADKFFSIVLSDKSDFTARYRAAREDTQLQLEPWRSAEEYSGLVRKVTYRAKCNSPMCPPDTAMTDSQHVFFSGNGQILVWESIQQAHDVPFGGSFEIHARWTVEPFSESTCKLRVKVGANFKKRLFMASKIRSGAEAEYKADALKFLDIVNKGLEEQAVNSSSSPSPNEQSTEVLGPKQEDYSPVLVD